MRKGIGSWMLAPAFVVLAACGAGSDASNDGVDTSAAALGIDDPYDAIGVTTQGAKVGTTLFGAAISPRTDARVDDLVSLWGGMRTDRAYDGGNGVSPFVDTQALDLRHHLASAYSFKYVPDDVVAGKHDAEITAFFQGIADHHPTYWTFYHEPDDELYVRHTFTPTAYRAAWAHIKGIANSVKAKRPDLKIHATLIIMEYSMTPKIAPDRPLLGADGMYPGDDVIDVFGVDTYNSDADKGGVRDAADQFGRIIDFAQAHNKPWAIGEIGSCNVTGNPNGRATYLRDAISYWKSRKYVPLYVTYFNDDDKTSCDYRIDNDAAANKVWRDAITLGYSAF